jgi:DNA-binding transcriptional regulator YiaG
MPKSLLDFTQVEALRAHMLLTTAQMSKLLGVSRVTYSGWVNGKPIRASNDAKARVALRKLFKVIEVHEWPRPEVIAMASAQRFKTLLELIEPSE